MTKKKRKKYKITKKLKKAKNDKKRKKDKKKLKMWKKEKIEEEKNHLCLLLLYDTYQLLYSTSLCAIKVIFIVTIAFSFTSIVIIIVPL